MGKGGAIRMTEQQLAELQRKRAQQSNAMPPVDFMGLPASRVVPPTYPGVPAQAGTSSKQKLQALGRLRDGTLNKTETAYAMHLTALMHAGQIQWFRFEGIKLRLADRTHLTVDFAVLAADGRLEMYDVKGAKAIVSDDARVKMKVAAEMYPFRFFMVYPKKAKDGGGWEIEEI